MPWLFAVLMLALTAVFAVLGVWQLNRLAEKEALVAAVAAALGQPPVPLATLDAADLDYRPVSLTGTFAPAETVLVFTSLSDPHGHYSGPGYWVVTPLVLAGGGGSVFVNRGFVPQDTGRDFLAAPATAPVEQTLTGIVRRSEQPGAFTPAADAANRIDWVLNVPRLAALVDPALAPFAPVIVDLPAEATGVLPQGGETVVEFPNNHLGYALTWFGFALITPVLLAFWLARQRRRPAAP